jgi:hypothetical protein
MFLRYDLYHKLKPKLNTTTFRKLSLTTQLHTRLNTCHVKLRMGTLIFVSCFI